MKYKTFQQKLDRFKREPIGFLVKSKEIADELAKVFTREGMVGEMGSSADDIMYSCLNDNGDSSTPWVSYNYTDGAHGLSYGLSDGSGKDLSELLDITLEELKPYNAPQTLEDKLKLFKAGTHVLHTPTQEIYDKLMVELEKRGYVWKTDDEPTCLKHVWKDNAGDTVIRCGYYHDGKLTYGRTSGNTAKDCTILTLTPEDFSTPQVITITSDGYHRTAAESNGVTAESLCNPTDTFDISKGSHIALKKLLEKLDEDTIDELGDLSGSTLEETEGFHVGDIVEIVWCYYSFADGAKGIQGVVVETGDDWCCVKLPVKFHDEVEWNFTDKQLKLVRKYNA